MAEGPRPVGLHEGEQDQLVVAEAGDVVNEPNDGSIVIQPTSGLSQQETGGFGSGRPKGRVGQGSSVDIAPIGLVQGVPGRSRKAIRTAWSRYVSSFGVACRSASRG